MTTNDAPNDLLTVEQVMEILQVSQSSIRNYVRTGKLPAVRVGGSRLLRVRRRDVELLLEPVKPGQEDV